MDRSLYRPFFEVPRFVSTSNKGSKRGSRKPHKSCFRYFGLPYILQSDNGKEFTAKVIEEVVQRWPGRCVIVRGRPYHPQSQGCVEKGHTSVKSMICTRRVDNGSGHWASWLGSIQCKSILFNKLLYMDYYQQSIVRPFIVYTNILIVLCS